MVEELYAKALSVGFDRRSVIVALGGGVVGDLAGFVAGTLLRGVRFIQVPTTLLAMVDSSVGGKTGVNLPQGKNLVGVFHQPVEVVADLDTLKTLPEREYLSGLAEVIKYGVIRDAAFFERLEARLDRLRARDADELEEVVARCCEIKAAVVSSDERETGERAILNFGHTLAHALENVGGYSRWLHGEAVAIGMAFAARLSEQQAGLPAADRQRIEAMLAALRLPVRVDQMAWEAVRHAMQLDKKVWRRLPRFALAERLGHAVFGREVPEEILIQTFKDICG
jgi:3-dehydroquinate synthase